MDLISEVMLYEQVLREEIFSCLGKLDYLINYHYKHCLQSNHVLNNLNKVVSN